MTRWQKINFDALSIKTLESNPGLLLEGLFEQRQEGRTAQRLSVFEGDLALHGSNARIDFEGGVGEFGIDLKDYTEWALLEFYAAGGENFFGFAGGRGGGGVSSGER